MTQHPDPPYQVGEIVRIRRHKYGPYNHAHVVVLAQIHEEGYAADDVDYEMCLTPEYQHLPSGSQSFYCVHDYCERIPVEHVEEDL